MRNEIENAEYIGIENTKTFFEEMERKIMKEEKKNKKEERKKRNIKRNLKRMFLTGLSFMVVGCGDFDCTTDTECEIFEPNPKWNYCVEEITTDLAGNEYRFLDDCYQDIPGDYLYLRTEPTTETNVRCSIEDLTIRKSDGLILYGKKESCEWLW